MRLTIGLSISRIMLPPFKIRECREPNAGETDSDKKGALPAELHRNAELIAVRTRIEEQEL
jgi:hypothetical protein